MRAAATSRPRTQHHVSVQDMLADENGGEEACKPFLAHRVSHRAHPQPCAEEWRGAGERDDELEAYKAVDAQDEGGLVVLRNALVPNRKGRQEVGIGASHPVDLGGRRPRCRGALVNRRRLPCFDVAEIGNGGELFGGRAGVPRRMPGRPSARLVPKRCGPGGRLLLLVRPPPERCCWNRLQGADLSAAVPRRTALCGAPRASLDALRWRVLNVEADRTRGDHALRRVRSTRAAGDASAAVAAPRQLPCRVTMAGRTAA
mmetsp:Transcript_39827/g.84994  ORF Transcript_39827/g.84994 Transcript_39827/m.84994 type:complete len:259 (+) Transcript_39827:590-1366(+)